MTSIKGMIGKVIGAAVVAGLAFVAGSLTPALLKEPVTMYVIPEAQAALGVYKVLQVFYDDPANPGNFVEADDEFAVYTSDHDAEVAGLIRRRVDGRVDSSKQSEVRGVRRDGVLTFTFSSTAPGIVGVGAFFGELDHDTGAYVGSMVGYAHDEGSKKCETVPFIAVLGDDGVRDKFLALANEARDNANSLKVTAKEKTSEQASGAGGAEADTCRSSVTVSG